MPYIEGVGLADYFRKSFKKGLTHESLGPKVTTSKRRTGRHLTEGNEIMKTKQASMKAVFTSECGNAIAHAAGWNDVVMVEA